MESLKTLPLEKLVELVNEGRQSTYRPTIMFNMCSWDKDAEQALCHLSSTRSILHNRNAALLGVTTADDIAQAIKAGAAQGQSAENNLNIKVFQEAVAVLEKFTAVARVEPVRVDFEEWNKSRFQWKAIEPVSELALELA